MPIIQVHIIMLILQIIIKLVYIMIFVQSIGSLDKMIKESAC